MNLNNLVKYIKSGMNMTCVPKRSKILVLGAGLVTFFGSFPGVILGVYWIYISIFMLISFIIAVITVFVLSSMKPTIKIMLINQLIICINWIVQLISLQTIIFTMAFGWRVELVLLYVPIILCPLIFGFIHCNKLKKEGSFSASEGAPWILGIVGASSGYAGMRLARNFGNMSQNSAILMVLICSTLISTVLSFGLLNIQRLYFWCKYKKSSVLTEDLFELEPFQKN